jgi:hypothetical protein
VAKKRQRPNLTVRKSGTWRCPKCRVTFDLTGLYSHMVESSKRDHLRSCKPISPEAAAKEALALKKAISDELERLRKGFEGGDPLNLNEAYLLCESYSAANPQWIRAALHNRLEKELGQTEEGKRRWKRKQWQLLRWHTFNWFRHKGYRYGVAKKLAAEFLGISGKTVLEGHSDFRKRTGLPKGLQPLTRGFEDLTPAAMLNLMPDSPPAATPNEEMDRCAAFNKRLQNLLENPNHAK